MMLKLRKKKRKRLVLNPRLSRLDPTRTLTIRRAFAARLRRKFAILNGNIVKLVLVEDAFGLKPRLPLSHFVGNVFCATGEGGGVDPTCSPNGLVQSAVTKLGKVIAEGTQDGYVMRIHEKQLAYVTVGRGDHIDDELKDFEGKGTMTVQSPTGEMVKAGKWMDWVERHWPKDTVYKPKEYRAAMEVEEQKKYGYAHTFKFHKDGGGLLTANTRWAFADDEAKLTSFKRWVKTQIDIDLRSHEEEELWRRYVEQGYRKGQERAYSDVMQARGKAAFGKIGDEQAAQAVELAERQARKMVLRGPASVESVRRLAARSLNELDDVTTRMATKMTRALANGLVQGKTPKQIAQSLVDEADLNMNRAMLISTTELTRAHAEGELDALEQLGVRQVTPEVEWTAAEGACDECSAMDGTVFDIDEARGMIPLHPHCYCAWTPVSSEE